MLRAHNESYFRRLSHSDEAVSRLDDGTASCVSSSTQSSGTRFRMQRLIGQADLRGPSSRSVAPSAAAPAPARAERPPPPGGEWPAAAEDAQRQQAFEQALEQFNRDVEGAAVSQHIEAARGRALTAVQSYQNYLRLRQAEVGDRLRIHKERYQRVLPSLIPKEDWSTWAIINGAQPLITANLASPFDAPSIIEFLRLKRAQKEALENIIKQKIGDIVRSHGDRISENRCRELLVERAHNEMVQLDLILFYLEMTALTRAQLDAIRQRARLDHFYAARAQQPGGGQR